MGRKFLIKADGRCRKDMESKFDMKKLLLPFCLVLSLITRAEDEKPLMSRALLHNTVRIEVQKADGTMGLGTGFFYIFNFPEQTSSIPVIVTCKHVIAGSVVGRIHFALSVSNSFARSQNDFPAVIPQFEQMWIQHPDTNVDLVVMPLAPIMKTLEARGKIVDFLPIGEKQIPSEKELSDDGAFQEVKFIGYPIGIWDEKNNLPVIRRGMTATDPAVDYNGRKEFLIDAAVFPGSSGSPVFIANEGANISPQGVFGGVRFQFLGILYAVSEYNSDGKVDVVTIPTAFDIKVRTGIPANLGIVIKSDRLNDFKTVLKEIANKQEALAKQPLSQPPSAAH
jgi:V8-like Glu-specific endopeptidase